MASSSSGNSSSQSPKKYDVFISFRGKDTRFNFTGHLYDALQRNQLDTYIDYRLEKGDEVWSSLERAIQDSTLFLVIFSENYASSTWCLKELTKIFDCSKTQDHLVIPVFYRVDPSHVRNQSGSYQKAFEKHENKGINNNQLQVWRDALTHAANLAGWSCSLDRNEAELIKDIMNCVETKLGPKYQSEDYLKGLIGIHKRMEYVQFLLDNGPNNVQFIAIWGMGGIGKTTLAKALFHKLRFDYEGFCFLANVREESNKYGIDSLREKLILKLLRDREFRIGMLDAVYPYAMRRLGRKKVLIVLDDVDDVEQLKILAKRHEFGSGSKILITTRDKQVLGDEVDDIYVLEGMNDDEAFDLFSINAFRNDYIDPKIIDLAIKVTQYASGNPLALKVLGSFLHGKNQVAWESQLDKLQKLPCPKINDILKMSLEGLDYEEKNIFLDIAFFFSSSYVEDVIKLLDACGYSTIKGLKSLRDKALLDTHHGRIHMHHLIKEMGRQNVDDESSNDPKRHSWLWNFSEIFEILKENMESETIEGITLNLSEVEDMCLSPQAFCSMPNLKFLDFHKTFNDDEVGSKLQFPCRIEFLPYKLRLLRWKEYPLKSLLATFKAEDLVEMILPGSNLTKFWDEEQIEPSAGRTGSSGSGGRARGRPIREGRIASYAPSIGIGCTSSPDLPPFNLSFSSSTTDSVMDDTSVPTTPTYPQQRAEQVGEDSFSDTPVWGSVDPTTGLMWIRPVGTTKFEPYRVVVEFIDKQLFHNYNYSWGNWLEIPQAVRDAWFNDFLEKFRWLPTHRQDLGKAYNYKSSRWLSDHLYKLRQNKDELKWVKALEQQLTTTTQQLEATTQLVEATTQLVNQQVEKINHQEEMMNQQAKMMNQQAEMMKQIQDLLQSLMKDKKDKGLSPGDDDKHDHTTTV